MKKQARSKGSKQSFEEKPDNLYWKKDKQWYLWFQDYEDETFKKLPGYKGLYFVSNYGKVISFQRTPPRELEPHIVKTSLTVNLSIDGKNKTYPVQKLVFLCFYGPLPRGIDVGHMNGNPRDNHVKNLGLRGRPQEKKLGTDANMERLASYPVAPTRGPGCREVLQFSADGRFIKEHPSIKEAARAVNSSTSLIVHTIKRDKNQRTSRGFQWFYKSDPRFKDGIKPVPPVKPSTVEVLQFSVKGKYLRSFETIEQAFRATKISRGAIKRNLQGRTSNTGNYQFRLRSDPMFKSGIHDIPAVKGKKRKPNKRIKVLQFDLQGRFAAEYPSLSHAAEAIEKRSGSSIHACLDGKGYTAGGFQWRRRDDPRFKNGITDIEPLSKPKRKTRYRGEILQFDLKGNFLHRYPGTLEAARAAGCKGAGITAAIRGTNKSCAGYQWRNSLDPRFKKGITGIPPIRINNKKRARPVIKLHRGGRKAAEYETIKAAAEAEGVAPSVMKAYLKGRVPMTSEFYWEYKENHPKHMGPPWLITPPPRTPPPNRRGVLQFDQTGRFIKFHPSISEATRATGCSVTSIAGCAEKKTKTSRDYLWYFDTDPLFEKGFRDLPPSELIARKKGIHVFSLEGKYIKTFKSKMEAIRELKTGQVPIDRHLNGKTRSFRGYQLRLASNPLFLDGIVDIPAVEPETFINPHNKKILKFDIYGHFIREFPSITEAARVHRCSLEQISGHLRGNSRTTVGFQWRYREDPRFRDGITDIEPAYKEDAPLIANMEILQFDLQGNYLGKYPRLSAAANAAGVLPNGIQACLTGRSLTCAGFRWRSITDPFFKDGVKDIPPLEQPPGQPGFTVQKFDREGRLVAEFPSITAAAADHGVSHGTMRYLLRGRGSQDSRFYWKLKDKHPNYPSSQDPPRKKRTGERK